MSENGKLPPLPGRGEIIQRLEALIKGDCSRDEVADWAVEWIINDGSGRDYPILDEEAWELLKVVAAADFKDSPSSYYYDEKDFADWIQEIKLQEIK